MNYTHQFNPLNLSVNTSNINTSSNINLPTNTNRSLLLDSDNIRCPVCNGEYGIYEYFTHLFIAHEEFLATWTSLSFPDLDPDNIPSLTNFFSNLGINTSNLMNETYTDYSTASYNTINFTNETLYPNPAAAQIVDGFDLLTYEQLIALCDEIGYHKLGIKNIDSVAPAIVRIKKGNLHDDNCPICLEDMHRALYMRSIKGCGHEFCGECIEKWLTDNKTCPICKLQLSEEQEENEEIPNQISSISESSIGGNDGPRLSPVPTPESSSESFANTT